MKLYHLDRQGTINTTESIRLQPFNDLAPEVRDSIFLREFLNGISSHGKHYLQTTPSYLRHLCLPGVAPVYIDSASIKEQKIFIDCQIIEVVCEVVRRAYFPQHPSRFTSLFCVEQVEDFLQWPELMSRERAENAKIIEVNLPEDTPKFDSRWLRGGLIFNAEPNNTYMGFLPVAAFDYAYRYWSGEATADPRWEYLVSLPIEQYCINDADYCRRIFK